jgi:hypothetical protein
MRAVEWFPDVVAMTDEHLNAFIQTLVREADVLGAAISAPVDDPSLAYQHRVLCGKLTIARAEMQRRLRERGHGGN